MVLILHSSFIRGSIAIYIIKLIKGEKTTSTNCCSGIDKNKLQIRIFSARITITSYYS